MCLSEPPPREEARAREEEPRDLALRAIRIALARADRPPEAILAEIRTILAAAGIGITPGGVDGDLYTRLWWAPDGT